MELNEIIKKRRSIRKWEEKEIPQQMIEKLIESIIWAPSAGNLQARKFYFVYNEEIRNQIAELANQPFVKKAPLIAVACADKEKSAWKYGKQGENLYCIIDTCLSVQNLMLRAADLGLGSVPVGVIDENGLKNLLNLPDGLRPFLIIPIGFPAEYPEAPARVSYNKAVTEIK